LETVRPGRGVCPGIIDCHVILQGVVVAAGELFHEVQFFCMWRSGAIHPKALVETGRVHDERVPFPMTTGIAVVARYEVCWMRLAVRVDHAEGVRSTDIENENLWK